MENETEAFLVSVTKTPVGTRPVSNSNLILMLILTEVKYKIRYLQVEKKSQAMNTR